MTRELTMKMCEKGERLFAIRKTPRLMNQDAGNTTRTCYHSSLAR